MILDGKTAIITGPASGIGAATAVRFSREGANLTLVDLDEAGLRRIEAECRKGGAGVLTIAGDAADLTVM
ncbi:MAG: SDR family NAD(P)-dependent oxidoreductase, partial [Nitrospinota bacterium]|nr:SDR family NAD(P)-dependent oxidoreductase [Nitrospinota bacterium]